MKRILNPEIKEYIVNFTINQLENCELFTKTFGKGFVERKLNDNLENAYTNAEDKIYFGYYIHEDKSITICASGKDGNLLTVKDIENIQGIKALILHECIHAILYKNEKESKKLKIKTGTGIREVYYNDSELGRGLNEGLTNWIVEKAGIKVTSYRELTNLIKQLEIYIGPNRVMQLAKRGISNNVCKCLGMTKSDVINLLSKSDEYYNLYKIHKEINNIKKILQKNKKEDGTIFLDEKALEELVETKYDMYTNPEKNIGRGYKEFLNIQGLQDTLENKLKYCEESDVILSEMLHDTQVDIESMLFNTYFKNKFESMKNNIDKVSIQDFKTLLNLETLITSGAKEDTKSSVVFKREIEEFKRKFLENKSTEINNQINNGELSKKDFLEIMDIFYSDEFEGNNLNNYKSLFLKDISKSIYPENDACIKDLIDILALDGKLDEINKYSLQEIKSKNGQSACLYYKDGKLDFAGKAYDVNKMRADKRLNKSEQIVNYTLELGVNEREIIKNFLRLKKNVEERDPKAKISISNRAIIVEPSRSIPKRKGFFMIVGENIVSVNPVRNEQTKIDFIDDKKSLALTIRKSNFISNIFEKVNNIKNRMLKKTYNDSSCSNNVVYSADSENSEKNKFDAELRNFKPIKTKSGIHRNSSESNKDFR